jgi:hypothetical protein
MSTIFQEKEQSATETPILLFDCVLSNGVLEQWATHKVVVGGATYQPRVLVHNLFQMQTSSDMGVDAIPQISVTLANADSHFSELERSVGWKGAIVTVTFLFFKLTVLQIDRRHCGYREHGPVPGHRQSTRRDQRGDFPAHGGKQDEHAASPAAAGSRGEALPLGVPR